MTDAPGFHIWSGTECIMYLGPNTTLSGIPAVHPEPPLLVAGSGILVASGTSSITVSSSISGLPTFFKEADEFTQITSSETFQLRLRMSVDIEEAGLYKFEWFYTWRLDSISDNFEARIQLDDTLTVMDHKEEPKDGGNGQSLPASGFDFVSLGVGPHFFDLDYRTSDGSQPAEIKVARMFLMRIA